MAKKNKITTEESSQLTKFEMNSNQLFLLTGLVALLYIAFSFFSNGFYQHDEAAHFINMRTFWYNPNIILGNWAKPGYKLIYVIPALAGPFAVVIVNAIFSAFTAFFSYRIAEKIGLRLPAIAFFLLASQPMWLQLAFRNYSEIPTAFLLSLGVWFFYRKQTYDLWFSAIILSYLTLLRQEFYVIGIVFALWLLLNKQWKVMFVLPLFPLFIHIWGWIVTDDPLYLITSTVGTAGAYKDEYPRLGFDHYFKMLIVVVGPMVLLGVIYSIKSAIKDKRNSVLWPLLSIALTYFLLHSLFNWQAVKIGASTGGNLRYMLVLSPLFAVLATAGFESVKTSSKDLVSLVIIGAFAFITLLFLSHSHNNIVYLADKNYTSFLTVLAFAAIFYVVKNNKLKWNVIVGIQLIYLIASVTPYKLSSEDKLMQQVVQWAENQNIFSKPTMTQHTLFYYFHGKVQQEFKGENESLITEETISAAKSGTVIFWDSHYSYRPNLRPTSVNYTWFMERANQFKLVKQFITPDKRFGVFVFEKL